MIKKMFDAFKKFLGIDYDQPKYMVVKNPEGKWGIYDEDGFSLRTYSRRRDAIRGAERAGYTIV
jgi:hypothetical protein